MSYREYIEEKEGYKGQINTWNYKEEIEFAFFCMLPEISNYKEEAKATFGPIRGRIR